MEKDKYIVYRCGWCGQPCDKDGRVLCDEVDEINTNSELKKAYDECKNQVPGNCCREQEIESQFVTREMAMDAGEPEMEGMEY